MIITLLRKPLDGSVAENVLKHGCGGLNIDDTRVGTEIRTYQGSGKSNQVYSESRAGMSDGRGRDMEFKAEGRWPANFILIHKEGYPCPIEELDRQSGHLKSGKDVNPTKEKVSGFFGKKDNYYSSISNYGDEGGASRFFKQFKGGES